jgi:hypothetical protein
MFSLKDYTFPETYEIEIRRHQHTDYFLQTFINIRYLGYSLNWLGTTGGLMIFDGEIHEQANADSEPQDRKREFDEPRPGARTRATFTLGNRPKSRNLWIVRITCCPVM